MVSGRSNRRDNRILVTVDCPLPCPLARCAGIVAPLIEFADARPQLLSRSEPKTILSAADHVASGCIYRPFDHFPSLRPLRSHPSIAQGKGTQRERCRCRGSQITIQRLGLAQQRSLLCPV